MINRLRAQFIAIASAAVLIVLGFFIAGINSLTYWQYDSSLHTILQAMSDNNGDLTNTVYLSTSFSENEVKQLKYMSLVVEADGQKVFSNTNRLNSSDMTSFMQVLDQVDSSSDKTGQLSVNNSHYAYQVSLKSDGSRLIVMLDASRFVDQQRRLFLLSLQIAAVSFLGFFMIVYLLSKRAIQPFVDNQERQKQFITNVGHELKTPLAIILANTELQELLTGETEWSLSTKDQTRRMTHLINQMISLARLEEQPDIELSSVNFSTVAQDAAEDFKGPILRGGKSFSMEIDPDIHVLAEEKSLFEMVTILVDNANKYCDDGGKILVRLTHSSRPLKRAKFEVTNSYKGHAHDDYSRFFERFYREDDSRNSQKKGFGIGLSMAQNLVRIFKGRISVYYRDESITFSVQLPLDTSQGD